MSDQNFRHLDTAPAHEEFQPRAGFFRRMTALVIDLFLIFIFFKLFGLLELLLYKKILAVTILAADGTTFDNIQAAFRLGNVLLGLLAPLLYFTVLERSRRGATIGKRILGVRVVSTRLKRIGFFRSLLRNLFKALSAALLFLGFLLAMFMPRKQALHDLLSGTLAVRSRMAAGEDGSRPVDTV